MSVTVANNVAAENQLTSLLITSEHRAQDNASGDQLAPLIAANNLMLRGDGTATSSIHHSAAGNNVLQIRPNEPTAIKSKKRPHRFHSVIPAIQKTVTVMCCLTQRCK